MTEMNKTIAFFQLRTLYIKELKPLCGGSTSAVILMQQLEYRFSGKPSGFYKFLSPCDHELYRDGDSWTEELGFSEKEFRGAFDKIGIRYKSINAYKKAVENNQDPFVIYPDDKNKLKKPVRKMYLCYVDAIKRVTVYLRNHQFVDKVIHRVILDFKPENAPESPEKYRYDQRAVRKLTHQDSPYLPNGNLPNCPMGSYVTDQRAVRYNKETNITANITAAANSTYQEVESVNDEHAVKAAAASFEEKNSEGAIAADKPIGSDTLSSQHPVILHADDHSIGTILSSNQQKRIAQEITQLCSKLMDTGVAKANLRDQFFFGKPFTQVCAIVESVIVDMSAFTKCSSRFTQKLSAIIAQIEKGNFYSIIEDVSSKPSQVAHKASEPSKAQLLLREIASIKGELNSHMQSLKSVRLTNCM